MRLIGDTVRGYFEGELPNGHNRKDGIVYYEKEFEFGTNINGKDKLGR